MDQIDNSDGKQLQERASAVSVSLDGLVRVGARPPIGRYLQELWRYRHFIFYDAKARVQSGNRRDRLGSAWLVLNPVLNGLTYYLIFGVLLNTSRGIENFVGYLVIGVFLFQFSARAITNGAKSIQANRTVIQAFSFPRATLPLAVNIREVIGSVPVIVTMLALILILPPAENITFLWLLIIPALLLQALFNLGVGLILARLIARVNDVSYLLSFFIRVWMYSSAVFYSFDRYVDHPAALAVLQANPLYLVLDIVRDSVLYGVLPDWQSWAALAAWSFGLLIVGLLFFWRGEETYGRD